MTQPQEKNEQDVTETHEEGQEVSSEQVEALAEEVASNDPVAALEQELLETKDRMLRALAEAENTRKRAEKMQADAGKFAVSKFAKDMLDVADNFTRALTAVPEDQIRGNELAESILDGVKATERSMQQAFERHGIKKIEPREGRFDPNIHEVMFESPVPGKEPGEIIQLIEAGYMIHDRLLRPAKVGVAKGGAGAGPSEHTVDEEV